MNVNKKSMTVKVLWVKSLFALMSAALAVSAVALYRLDQRKEEILIVMGAQAAYEKNDVVIDERIVANFDKVSCDAINALEFSESVFMITALLTGIAFVLALSVYRRIPD